MISWGSEDLYDSVGVRRLERSALSDTHITGWSLMQRAGEAAYKVLRARWPMARRITVVCGVGNNGGDGFAIATLAHGDGLQVEAKVVGDIEILTGDALTSYKRLRNTGILIDTGWAPLKEPDVIVDALLGTGLDRPVIGEYEVAIGCINSNSAPVLSVDVPSGINSSTGTSMGSAVKAEVTVTFIGLKQGLTTGDALDYRGEVIFDGLGISPEIYAKVPATARLERYETASRKLTRRSRIAHKGDYGHVLVVGGAPGYSGAVRMAAEAAARTGAGLVSVGAHPTQVSTVAQARPELMCHGISTPGDLRALLGRATVLAVGPGFGVSDWSRALFAAVRDCKQPLVLDADGLNLLADDPDFKEMRILTPHLGEASRLLGMKIEDICADRLSAARTLVENFGGVVVLKGAGTIIQTAGATPLIISEGNPGMASGGMGDLLTGVIAGLLSQGFPLKQAASLGACVHSYSADRAVERSGERGLLATDLLPFLRAGLNP